VTAGAATCVRDTVPLLRLEAEERRRIFYLKTDCRLSDDRLRSLKAEAEAELGSRVACIEALSAEIGLSGRVEPLAAGTYHVVHKVTPANGQPVVFRSTLVGVFEEDRTLLVEGYARASLARVGDGGLVPNVLLVRFRRDGAPFDFAVMEFIRYPTLRDLGDELLDLEPTYLVETGRVLRRVHRTIGRGAGLLELAEAEAACSPRGVHDLWADYLWLNLEAHVAACARAGFLDRRASARILDLFRKMRPAVEGRPMRLLHGDPGIHNLCVDVETKRIAAILDWEDALVGDPLFDVAMVSSFQPSRRMSAFMAGYGLEQPSREEQRLIALYFLRIALSKTVHRLRFGVVDRPDRTPGHHRIYRGVDDLERLIGAS